MHPPCCYYVNKKFCNYTPTFLYRSEADISLVDLHCDNAFCSKVVQLSSPNDQRSRSTSSDSGSGFPCRAISALELSCEIAPDPLCVERFFSPKRLWNVSSSFCTVYVAGGDIITAFVLRVHPLPSLKHTHAYSCSSASKRQTAFYARQCFIL